MFRAFLYFSAICCAIVMSGCAGNPVDKWKTEQAYYEQAQQEMADKKWLEATATLEAMDDRYPFGPYSPQVQLDLMFIYYEQDKYDLALRTANRFIRLHPASERLDYAYFMRGMVSFGIAQNGGGILSDRSEDRRDTSQLERAFVELADFIGRYPDSPYVEQATGMQQIIRGRLASKEFRIARFYFEKKAYEAALLRADNFLQQFSGSHLADDASALKIRALQKLERTEEAASVMAQFEQNFPNSELMQDGKLMVDFAFKRSWKFWLTLGVLD